MKVIYIYRFHIIHQTLVSASYVLVSASENFWPRPHTFWPRPHPSVASLTSLVLITFLQVIISLKTVHTTLSVMHGH